MTPVNNTFRPSSSSSSFSLPSFLPSFFPFTVSLSFHFILIVSTFNFSFSLSLSSNQRLPISSIHNPYKILSWISSFYFRSVFEWKINSQQIFLSDAMKTWSSKQEYLLEPFLFNFFNFFNFNFILQPSSSSSSPLSFLLAHLFLLLLSSFLCFPLTPFAFRFFVSFLLFLTGVCVLMVKLFKPKLKPLNNSLLMLCVSVCSHLFLVFYSCQPPMIVLWIGNCLFYYCSKLPFSFSFLPSLPFTFHFDFLSFNFFLSFSSWL